MEYLITPPEATDWKIDNDLFMEDLTKTWSDVSLHIIKNQDDYHYIEWTIMPPQTQQRLDGSLHRDQQGVSLDGSIEDCAKFAFWFRFFVPSYQKLIFYDQGYNSQIELQTNTDEKEIIQTFSTLIMTGSN